MTDAPARSASPDAGPTVPTDLAPPPDRLDGDAVVDRAVALAEQLVGGADRHRSRRERGRRRRIARLLADPAAVEFTIELTDAVLRIPDHERSAQLLASLIRRGGVPRGLGRLDRVGLHLVGRFAERFPRLVMPAVALRVHADSAGVVLAAEDAPLSRHIARRRGAGIDLNLNVLGEAILGEQEAVRRLDAVAATLRRPDVDYVSVKVSSVASQLNALAFDDSVERVADRLRTLYALAATADPPKFVNLDMEEFRDLELTVAVFRRLLDEPALRSLEAGIVLQAYLPDSYRALQELTAWAIARRAAGGGAIKVRLVKGANLAMEHVEAELHGWTPAPYGSKPEVDANYKRLVDWALVPEHAAAVRVGVASHNLFDVAWALSLAERREVTDRVEIEMLEGMAEGEATVVRSRAGRILLYAPITRKHDLPNAVAYLVRRLDENTAPENYLRASFSIRPGSPAFREQEARFRAAVAQRHDVAAGSRRAGTDPMGEAGPAFVNEPDADFAVAAQRDRVLAALAQWRERPVDPIPLVIDGEAIAATDRATADGVDPSRPDRTRYVHALATLADVERAVDAARRAHTAWNARPLAERRAVLDAAAAVMEAERFETIGVMATDAGKVAAEGDPEVSEAIDFARYYGRSAERLAADTADGLRGDGLGVVVVTPPWNFPYAIPAGGVLAALAAGNAVIFKPAPQTVLTAWQLAQQLWRGGVPRDVLQFVPCPDDEIGRRLVTHERVDAVILTGSRDTADLFRSWKPEMHLLAETSGKNAVVITAAADVDVAVRDLVRSAFGHAGQKCSAASLAIVEATVYDRDAFRRQLADAVRSLVPGPAWDPVTTMGPVIEAPGPALRRALTTLEAGETWLVEPTVDATNTNQWSPGVKLGVAPGSFFHLTECFGPVLGVMRAPDLDTAIAWQNAPAFGLTGGIFSLDVAELQHWTDRVEVGNAYVNRGTTGAVVQRQPFGGWKASVVGPAAKAGGPNYLAGLQRWTVTDEEAWTPARVQASFDSWWGRELSVGHDPSALASERNVFRYKPLGAPVIVVHGPGVERELAVLTAAAHRCGEAVETIPVAGATRLAGRLEADPVARVRFVGDVPAEIRSVVLAAGAPVDDTPVLPHGRLELLRWLREQAVSVTTHRYGNVGAAPVPRL